MTVNPEDLNKVNSNSKDLNKVNSNSEVYVSANGNDENDGTYNNPYKTFEHALAVSDNIIFIGEYILDKEVIINKNITLSGVDDFENLLKTLPKPLGVEANFGAIDANGNGAYFETGNYKYVKYDLKDEPSGILTRTNYSYSGRPNEGYGFIREKNEQTILRPHILGHDITPAVFTEEVARTFYHSLIGENYTNGSQQWVVDLDFIPRRSSAATTVIEGVIPGEDASLTTMWIALGYPPCADVFQVWCEENGVPVVLQGTGENNHSPQCDLVLKRKNEVFPLTAGNGKEYLDITKLYNEEKTGFCQVLIPLPWKFVMATT